MFAFAPFIAGFVGVIKTLFLPPVLYFTLLAATIVGGYWYHTSAVTESYKAGIDFATSTYETVLKEERQEAYLALIRQKAGQDLILAEVESKLQAAEAKAQIVKIVIKEVATYVTKEADSACVIPAGFVWMHQLSTAADPSSMAASKPKNVDAPTSVKLSEVAALDAANNAECQVRGAVITEWQGWYVKNKLLFEAAIATQEKPK